MTVQMHISNVIRLLFQGEYVGPVGVEGFSVLEGDKGLEFVRTNKRLVGNLECILEAGIIR